MSFATDNDARSTQPASQSAAKRTADLPSSTRPESPWWDGGVDELLARLKASQAGLTQDEADARRGDSHSQFGHRTDSDWMLLLSQFRSPTTLILIAASLLSLILKDNADAAIILVIVVASALLGFWQERTAAQTIKKLLELVKIQTTVVRNGREQQIWSDDVVVGDIVALSAGSSVPADCRLLDANDLHLDEAALTGETFPVEKQPGIVPATAGLAQRTNALFLGTHVVSGTGRVVVAACGTQTEFGRISEHLRPRAPETDFEKGVRRFGYFLMEITFLLVVSIFAINVYLHKPIVESLLFALALAVGLTPQLLPAIIMVNLTYGAKQMAERKVVVRRLASIENFGSMDVLCSDKTGTLTEGVIQIHDTVDPRGTHSDFVSQLIYWNARHETGFSNAIDDAIRANPPTGVTDSVKLDEVPYDFLRKRLSILVDQQGRHLLITKGAVANVLEVCAEIESSDGCRTPLNSNRRDIASQFEKYSQQGYRTLGVAYRDMGSQTVATRNDESSMVFAGFVVLRDPPKPDSANMIRSLKDRGVSLKIVTGDNRWVATEIAREVGLSAENVVTGEDLRKMSSGGLVRKVSSIDVFAEVEPAQKERIILALRHAGHVVGYLGDGINDATALHAADVGISVDSAVDVAKEAADIILLRRDLSVLADGIQAGRQTFANTVKYIYMATSANFGNMFSMAGASLFLPYLPLLPHQILLTNVLTDLSAMTIASDTVDQEDVATAKRWNIRFIRNFMLVFGLLSSVFDYVTFAVLLWLLRADMIAFRTGWFVESVCSATLIVLIIRTRRSIFQSRASRPLFYMSLLVVIATVLLPISSFAKPLGFAPQPLSYPIAMTIIVVIYLISAEITKRFFYSATVRHRPPQAVSPRRMTGLE
jgi:Mg2+-importing ATPase